ncbi:hypothetical protein EVAR_93384_1 [Eumeta japonica]|uniref:Uncharacterized protein n=1 Tax=Eumeta variegata TaxID=151549 RepID=A0A4C1UQX9_EUMVA|nr:hypothetical protein EVAR_93384_1 [Eumeta japonica]
MMQIFAGGDSDVVYDIVIGDESWIYSYDLERQSAQSIFPFEEFLIKLKRSRIIEKKMVAFFFGMTVKKPLKNSPTVKNQTRRPRAECDALDRAAAATRVSLNLYISQSRVNMRKVTSGSLRRTARVTGAAPRVSKSHHLSINRRAAACCSKISPDEVDEVTDIEEGPDDDMGVIPVSDVAGQVEFSCTIDQTVYKSTIHLHHYCVCAVPARYNPLLSQAPEAAFSTESDYLKSVKRSSSHRDFYFSSEVLTSEEKQGEIMVLTPYPLINYSSYILIGDPRFEFGYDANRAADSSGDRREIAAHGPCPDYADKFCALMIQFKFA